MIVEELKVPRFGLPSLACLVESDPFLRYRQSTYAVAASSKTWSEARARLESDIDSDLSDLLKGISK